MEKVWLKQYQEGVPETIEVTHTSLPALFDECFEKFESKPAYSCLGTTVNFATIDQASRQFAAYLQQLGLKKGDRVAVMMPNLLAYPVAVFSILRAGLTVVNVNPLYTERELEHQLKDSGASVLIVMDRFATTAEKALDAITLKQVIITQASDLMPIPKRWLVQFILKYVKKQIPNIAFEHTTFSAALSKGKHAKFSPVDLSQGDVAFLQYTGGTTGRAKGAMLTHGNMLANLAQAHAWLKPSLQEGSEIVITALPLYHIFSLLANCLLFSSIGGLNVLIPNPRDIPAFVGELKKWPFTAITGVNTLFNALLHSSQFKSCDFSHLKLALGGGMAVQHAVAEKWQTVTGHPLIEAYGLTETSPAACINPFNSKEYNGSIGLPIPSTEISIRDDEDNELGFNEPGELCIKGPQVMLGYWNNEEETNQVLDDDGWLKTGDIATVDEQGFVRIVDRKKDMILVSGFNVYPNEVEDVVAEHPGVVEVAAVGEPNPISGEVVKIYVVKDDPDLTQQELLRYCREHLTGYKVPKTIEFRDELPKTNVGKILRRALKENEARS